MRRAGSARRRDFPLAVRFFTGPAKSSFHCASFASKPFSLGSPSIEKSVLRPFSFLPCFSRFCQQRKQSLGKEVGQLTHQSCVHGLLTIFKKRKTRESVPEENPYKTITRWFDAGNQLNLSFDLKDEDKIQMLYKVDGLFGAGIFLITGFAVSGEIT